MLKLSRFNLLRTLLIVEIALLVVMSLFVQRSIAPASLPVYGLYLVVATVTYVIFSSVDLQVFFAFSWHLYFFSILLLGVTLIIGQVTRGVVRWIPIGPITIQASEIIKPFVILFFARYVTEKPLSFARLTRLTVLFLIPFVLILIQPSLGVAILVSIAFIGVLAASSIDKKYLIGGIAAVFLLFPVIWLILAPYQKSRLVTFFTPTRDPHGAGYNSIQSMIAVGSGGITGRGLGKGIQTQLAFLPERHTDFIFAATSEELGFWGAATLLTVLLCFFLTLVSIMSQSVGPAQRAFLSGIILIFLTQTAINIGMNMGLLPITGIPLPFVSAGGSSLISSMIAIAMATNVHRKVSV